MSNSKYPVEPDSFPEKGSSGSGGIHAYSVQARYAYPSGKIIAGQLLDTRWSRIHYEKSPIGVPTGARYHQPWLDAAGLFSYPAAQALRWWFLAAAENEFSALCVETRLVEHNIDYSFSETSLRAVDEVERSSAPRDKPATALTPADGGGK